MSKISLCYKPPIHSALLSFHQNKNRVNRNTCTGATATRSACAVGIKGGELGLAKSRRLILIGSHFFKPCCWQWHGVGSDLRQEFSALLGSYSPFTECSRFQEAQKGLNFQERNMTFHRIGGGKCGDQCLPEDYLNPLLSVPEAKSIITPLLLPWTSFYSVNETILIICPRWW